jgi:hypothetical protein
MASTMVFRGQSDGRERERDPIALNRNVTPARRKTVFVENARARRSGALAQYGGLQVGSAMT